MAGRRVRGIDRQAAVRRLHEEASWGPRHAFYLIAVLAGHIVHALGLALLLVRGICWGGRVAQAGFTLFCAAVLLTGMIWHIQTQAADGADPGDGLVLQYIRLAEDGEQPTWTSRTFARAPCCSGTLELRLIHAVPAGCLTLQPERSALILGRGRVVPKRLPRPPRPEVDVVDIDPEVIASPSATSRCLRIPGCACCDGRATVRPEAADTYDLIFLDAYIGPHPVSPGDREFYEEVGPLTPGASSSQHHRDAPPARRVLPIHHRTLSRCFLPVYVSPVQSGRRLGPRRHQHHPVRHAGVDALSRAIWSRGARVGGKLVPGRSAEYAAHLLEVPVETKDSPTDRRTSPPSKSCGEAGFFRYRSQGPDMCYSSSFAAQALGLLGLSSFACLDCALCSCGLLSSSASAQDFRRGEVRRSVWGRPWCSTGTFQQVRAYWPDPDAGTSSRRPAAAARQIGAGSTRRLLRGEQMMLMSAEDLSRRPDCTWGPHRR